MDQSNWTLSDSRTRVYCLFIFCWQTDYHMSEKETWNFEQRESLGTIDPPPAEPIYDLTTSDKTNLVKAAGPIERGENP